MGFRDWFLYLRSLWCWNNTDVSQISPKSSHPYSNPSLKAENFQNNIVFFCKKKFGGAKGMGRLDCTKDTLYLVTRQTHALSKTLKLKKNENKVNN